MIPLNGINNKIQKPLNNFVKHKTNENQNYNG